MGAAAGDRSLKLLIQTQLPSAPREERVVRREEVRVGDLALRREQLRLADRRPELLFRRVVEGLQLFQRRLIDDAAERFAERPPPAPPTLPTRSPIFPRRAR